jgi:hypothetical protein
MAIQNHVDGGQAPPLSIASETHAQKESAKGAAEKPLSARSPREENRLGGMLDIKFLRTCGTVVSWTPKRCRWDPDDPPKFSFTLNLLFAFVSLLHGLNLACNPGLS